jgi:outer membrane protein OmpA-like peptidoglycan-associated protein
MKNYFGTIAIAAVLVGCQGGKDLAKLSQKQVLQLKPNPLELHGGQVRGELQVKLPQELEKKAFGYEAQVVFSSKEFTGEVLKFSIPKGVLAKDTTFAFAYAPNQTEYGDLLLKAKILQKKNKIYETPFFNIGRGVLTTALLFQQSPEPALCFYPFQKTNTPINEELTIYFEPKSAVLSDAEKEKLKAIQKPMKIRGFFSPEGAESENFALAQKRAEAVKEFLESQKISTKLEPLNFQEWKNYLFSLIDENTKKSLEKVVNASQVHSILQSAENTSFYQEMRVAKTSPLQPADTSTKNMPKDTAQWVALWEKEIEKNPNSDLHHQIGTWYAQKFLKNQQAEAYQKAITHFQTAINIGARGETFYNYAYLLKRKNETKKADSLLKKSLERGCSDTLILQWLNEWQGLQSVKEATSAKDEKYQKALANFEKSGKGKISLFNQGLVHLLTYQYDKASQLFEQIQDFSLALYARAIVGMRKGNEQECLEWLAKSFQKDKKLKNKAQKDMEFWQVRENAIMK